MAALTSPFVWAGVVSGAVGLLIALLAWRQRGTPGARIYAVLMIVLAGWAGMYVIQLLAPSIPAKKPWLIGRHAISPGVAILFWVFTAQYTDRRDLLSPRYTTPILVGAGSLLLLVLLNPSALYWRGFSLYTDGTIPRIAIEYGPAYWFMNGYIFAVVGGGHIYFVSKLMDSFAVYRRQLAAMAVVGVIEFAIAILTWTEHTTLVPSINPWPNLQLITYNLVFVAVPLGWSYLKQSLFNLQVLDRQAVIENMEDGVFVFDSNDIVRSVNEPGRELLDITNSPEGQTATEMFSETPILLDAYRTGGTTSTEAARSAPDQADTSATEATGRPEMKIDSHPSSGNLEGEHTSAMVTVDGTQRWYDINVSRITNSVGERTGTVLVVRDVTVRHRHRTRLSEQADELKEKTATLERQNERLEQFASMISHDLRNPLNVAQLRFEYVRDDVPADHATSIAQNLDRMEAMIDDLLTLARAGQTIETTDTVALRALATDAWDHIETPDCTLTLDIPEGTTVEGDRDRLLNVFENLFRNAADHNEPPMTIRVGTLGTVDETRSSSGFFVADDGTGIPEDASEAIFEHGYTTSDDGTGFGLAIVHDIVEAHGWTIRVSSSEDGGARFEIDGVELTN